MSFRVALKNITRVRWLLDPEVGERFLFALGMPFDALADWMNEGVKARMPGAGTPTALYLVGRDRDIQRGFQEPAESYALRLRHAFETWQYGGLPFGIEAALRAYVSPADIKVRLVNATHLGSDNLANWKTTDVGGAFSRYYATGIASYWFWRVATPETKWWRSYAILYAANVWTRRTWGSGTWGSGTWGSTMTSAQARTVRQILRKWGPARQWYQWIIVAFDDAVFDPMTGDGCPTAGGWDKASYNDGGVQKRRRDSRAIYLQGPDAPGAT